MLVASLLIASFVIFGALYLAPGNPITALSGGRALPPASLHVLEQRYHLNQPFLVAVLVLAGQRPARQPGHLDHAAAERLRR